MFSWSLVYLHGLDFKLFTDPKLPVPLIIIIMHDLDKLPMQYNLEAQYALGKQLVVADTLSQAPQPGEISKIE